MLKTISKAQEKRNAQTRAMLVGKVSKQLMDFQNQYIRDYVDYEIAQIKVVANAWKGTKDIKNVEKFVVGKTLREVKAMNVYSKQEIACMTLSPYINGEWVSRFNTLEDDLTVDGINLRSVNEAKRKLELLDLYKVEFYVDAQTSYNIKFNKVIDKMMQHEFSTHLVVENVGAVGGEFEILIWSPKTENAYTSDRDKKLEGVEFFFHARLIYANGMIKRPHFRFITTTRKTYLPK